MILYEALIYIAIFVIGLCFGSFLNVVADRLFKHKPIINARSICFFCNKKLAWLDLVPLLSFFLLRGKCKYCDAKLSVFYPLSEFLTGLGFVVLLNFSGVMRDVSIFSVINVLYLLAMFCLFMIIFLSDAKYQIIPDVVVFPGIILSFGYAIFDSFFRLWNLYQRLLTDEFGAYLLKAGYFKTQVVIVSQGLIYTGLTALGIYLFLLFLVYITKGRGMGRGDIKLGFMIGLFNGFPNGILAIFFGFLAGAVYGVALIFSGKKKMKDVIPFGPFLIFGSFAAMFFGNLVLEWYLRIL